MNEKKKKNFIDYGQLPPLNSFKGFEITARKQSLGKAAEELHVTTSAVRHQIKILEDSLGLKLFSKAGRNIELSEAGKTLYPYVKEALYKLSHGLEAVQTGASSSPLRIQAYITLSIRWLSHLLPAFHADCPHIRTELLTSNASWEFDESGADVGIVYCKSVPSDRFYWKPFFDYRVFPVCSPSLLDESKRLKPDDLLDMNLLAVSTEVGYWQDWFDSLGIDFTRDDRQMVVDAKAIALEMALDGKGVALATALTVSDYLSSKRLVVPVSHEAVFPGSWGVICRQEMKDDPRVYEFTNWVLETARPCSD